MGSFHIHDIDVSFTAPGVSSPVAWILLTLIVAACGFWLWMLCDCLMNKSLAGTEKILWVVAILFLHLLGAVIYFLGGRSKHA